MKKIITSAFIVLTMMFFGSALSSSAGEYYYYKNKGYSKGHSIERYRGKGHSVERHGGRDRGYRPNVITPSNPFDDEIRYYYNNDARYRNYYYKRDYDKDDDVKFKLDFF